MLLRKFGLLMTAARGELPWAGGGLLKQHRSGGAFGRALHAMARSRAVAAAVVVVVACAANGHPKPGAHADVRVRIDESGVRVEALMNILFADQIVNVERRARDAVRDEEREPLKAALVEYFGGGRAGAVTALVAKANRVKVDGVEVTPLVREMRVVYPEPETRPGFVQNPALLLPQIHVVAEYPVKTSPRNVSLIWGTFPRDFQAQGDRDLAPITDVEAVLTYGSELDIVILRHDEPEYTWHAPAGERARPLQAAAVVSRSGGRWEVSVVSLALGALSCVGLGGAVIGRGVVRAAGVGGAMIGATLAVFAWPLWRVPLPGIRGERVEAPSAAAAAEIFETLHANIYRAFDYAKESDVYDALARSVDGPLLDRMYDEVYRSLVMQEEGGALSRVKSIQRISSDVQPATAGGVDAGAFAVECRWRVEGVVYHWGHSHTRINEHAARYVVAPRGEQWRIVEGTALEQFRVQTDEQAASPASATTQPARPTGGTGVWRPTR